MKAMAVVEAVMGEAVLVPFPAIVGNWASFCLISGRMGGNPANAGGKFD